LRLGYTENLPRVFVGEKNVASKSSALVTGGAGGLAAACLTAGAGWSADGHCLSLQPSCCTADTASVAGNWGRLRGSRDGHHDAGRCDQLIKTVADRFGRLDIIVNNVGDFRWERWRNRRCRTGKHLDFESTHGSVHVPRRTAAYAQSALGRIINMGAVGAERAFGQAKISAYAAAKAAVVALSRSLALEEAKNGITVNVVNPSSIDEMS